MSSFLDIIRNLFRPRRYGVYTAVVTDNKDPDQLGRVLVSLPVTSGGEPAEAWARLSAFMAGAHRGAWFLPEIDDEVLVAFEHGDPDRPYILGALWNAEAPPPEHIDASGHNQIKSLHSRNGIIFSLFDATGDEALLLQTPGGQSVALQDGKGGSVEIRDASGSLVRLSSEGVQVSTSGKVSVQASVVEVSAASITVNAGLCTFSGVIRTDLLIATTVVSNTYTNGAGNVW